MNPHQNLLFANKKNITLDAVNCEYNRDSKKWDIRFQNERVYSYAYDNVVWLREPTEVDPRSVRFKVTDRLLYGIAKIFVFAGKGQEHWHFSFQSGVEETYAKQDLAITRSGLNDGSRNLLSYFKKAAEVMGLEGDDGTNLLYKQLEKLDFVDETMAFTAYTAPSERSMSKTWSEPLVFPFGCNSSQLIAVENALSNQVSVIQGPPGTGKTQTILNILANLLIAGKTVQVVSSNNLAVANVLEKLASPEYGLGFVVAPLGSRANKEAFIEGQKKEYPADLASWRSDEALTGEYLGEIQTLSQTMKQLFKLQEQRAVVQQHLRDLEVEHEHFVQTYQAVVRASRPVKARKDIDSDTVLRLWHECETLASLGRGLSWWWLFKNWLWQGLAGLARFKNDLGSAIVLLQELFYATKRIELQSETEAVENQLAGRKYERRLKEFCGKSMTHLKAKLYEKYGGSPERRIFNDDDLFRTPQEVQKEYPIVLSTNFSARSSLSKDATFDYVIVDEASQVDVVTGALALSCAKNAVIVGDAKQLPNVIPDRQRADLSAIFAEHGVREVYNYATKSFLQSVCEVLPQAPQTLLREHYRCHPRIINFCNQKFYDGKLLIMTKDAGEPDVLSVTKTVPGNHVRERVNQRQTEVLMQEVMPLISHEDDDIGIIAPYNNQVNALKVALTGRSIDVATVHSFQGREKQAIVIVTVDDQVTSFSDDPNLVNVAISRAKKNLHIITSGNPQPPGSNLGDLIDYIEYNRGRVVESPLTSIFDYLYRHHAESRERYLKAHQRISEFDSENLMSALIQGVLKDEGHTSLGVVFQQPLRALIRDYDRLNEDERRYAFNHATHVDFVIYHRFSKQPALAIEVDGYHYHKAGTRQSMRDTMKDAILRRYNVPLLRFKTNGSGERDLLVSTLAAMMRPPSAPSLFAVP